MLVSSQCPCPGDCELADAIHLCILNAQPSARLKLAFAEGSQSHIPHLSLAPFHPLEDIVLAHTHNTSCPGSSHCLPSPPALSSLCCRQYLLTCHQRGISKKAERPGLKSQLYHLLAG